MNNSKGNDNETSQYLQRFNKYGLEHVFAFEYPDFVLVGYPVWYGIMVYVGSF